MNVLEALVMLTIAFLVGNVVVDIYEKRVRR